MGSQIPSRNIFTTKLPQLLWLGSILFLIQNIRCTSVECPSTVVIENPEYEIYASYNTTDTTFSYVKATLGPSGAIYYAAKAGTDTTIFSKEDTNGTVTWAKAYNPLIIFQKGFLLSGDEQTLYAINDESTTEINLFKISPTDGSIVQKYQETSHISFVGRTMWAKLQLSPDNTVIFYAVVASPQTGVICRFLVSGTSSECFEAGTLQDLTTLLYVNSTHLFITARDTSDNNPVIGMVEWGQTTPAWQNKRTCVPLGGCETRMGSATLSSDGASIYSLFAQNSARYLTFAVYNTADGAIIGDRYRTNINTFQGCYDVQIHGDILYCLVYQNSFAEFYAYNISSNTWLHYLLTDSPFGSLLENSQKDVIFVYGTKNSKAYKIGFYLDTALDHNSISTSAYTMVAITSDYTETVGGSWIAFGSLYSVTLDTFDSSNATETIEAVEFVVDNTTSWETNIFEVSTATSINITSGEAFSEDPGSTCTTTPARTDITYEILDNGSTTAPTWISLNVTSGKYEGTAPTVNESSSYSFMLNSSWTTDPAGDSQQVVTIIVNPAEVNETEEPVALSAAAAAATAGAAGGGGAAVIVSAVSGNPPTGVYFILHQLQMIILFLMIDPYIPESMKTYLESQSFALVNFNFVPTADLPGVELPVNWLDSEQKDDVLQALGIESNSTLVNNMSLFISVIILICIHLLLRFVLICGSRQLNPPNRFFRFWNWFRIKLIDIIKYALYMRLFIESHEAMLLSACSEIYEWEVSTPAQYVSVFVAIFVLIASIILPVLAFYVFWKYRNQFDPDKKFFLMEFLSDLRNAKVARIYMALMLTRRILFVIMVIFLVEVPREFIYSTLLVCQLGYLIILAIIRPFDSTINNLIEYVNELFLFVVIAILFSYNKASKWTDSAESRLLAVLTTNGYLVLLIMIVGLIIMIVAKCVSKDRKKEYEESEEIDEIEDNPTKDKRLFGEKKDNDMEEVFEEQKDTMKKLSTDRMREKPDLSIKKPRKTLRMKRLDF